MFLAHFVDDITVMDFLEAFIAPVWDVAEMILSYPVFGFPFWSHMLALYVVSFAIGFVVQGQVGLGFGGAIGGLSSRSEALAREREKTRQAEIKERAAKSFEGYDMRYYDGNSHRW